MRARLSWVVLTCVLTLTPLSGRAADRPIPRFNVEANCDEAALNPRNQGDYKSIYSQCIMREQEQYNTVKAIWSTVENRVVDYCNGAYGNVGTSPNFRIKFYEVYLACLQYFGPGYFEGKEQREQVRKEFQFQR